MRTKTCSLPCAFETSSSRISSVTRLLKGFSMTMNLSHGSISLLMASLSDFDTRFMLKSSNRGRYVNTKNMASCGVVDDDDESLFSAILNCFVNNLQNRKEGNNLGVFRAVNLNHVTGLIGMHHTFVPAHHFCWAISMPHFACLSESCDHNICMGFGGFGLGRIEPFSFKSLDVGLLLLQ